MIDEEDSTARLLRLAGARPMAPDDRAARVRGAVHDEWRSATRRRIARVRATIVLAVLAVAGAAAAIAVISRSTRAPQPADVVAHVERVEGSFPLARGAPLRAQEWVDTRAARVALRLPDGASVRVDSASRLRLLSAHAIELAGGGVYIDTGHRSAGLEVRTAFGTARDIGTQFEARVDVRSLQVRVRTGVVELRRGEGDAVSARAGIELTLQGGEVTRRPVSRDGPEWAWAAALAPRFDIEGRSVAAFLEHLSSEQGWSLRYADAALARDASSIILHGSVAGLEAEQALAVALATSDLVHRVSNGELVVSRRARGVGAQEDR